MNFKISIVLLFFIIIYADEKSSIEIQDEIDSRNTQIELLKQEILKAEESIIEKIKNEIAASEILLELQNKINLTEKLINNIERDERLIRRQIDESQIQVMKTEKLIEETKKKIEKNIIYAYKNGLPTLFELILNSNNLNDIAYKKKYLNIVNEFQKNNKEKLKNKKQLKKNKEQEKKNIKNDMNKKNKLLRNIRDEKEVKKLELAKKQKDLIDIENIINELYTDKKTQEKREKELAEIRKLQKMAVNGNFSSMKGKLPWPIKGTIISKFGNKKNDTLNTITENLGIDIKTSKNKSVTAVLDGVVSTITYIRGHGDIIILDHGDGFNTVYSNIANISIKENEYVSAGQKIAEVNQSMILHFEIWGNQKKKNPEKWLIK